MSVNKDDLNPCPHCSGRGVIVSPHYGTEDGECTFCSGTGFTLKYIRCLCGRQVDLTCELRPGVFFCGREKCEEAWKKNLPVEKEATCCLNG